MPLAAKIARHGEPVIVGRIGKLSKLYMIEDAVVTAGDLIVTNRGGRREGSVGRSETHGLPKQTRELEMTEAEFCGRSGDFAAIGMEKVSKQSMFGRKLSEAILPKILLYKEFSDGAGRRIRTDDLLITNQLLYQLSYAGFLLWKMAFKSQFTTRFLYASSTHQFCGCPLA